MKFVASIASAALLAGIAVPANAAVTFGQFLQKDPSARLFQYLKQDVGLTKKAELHTTGTAASSTTASIPVYYLMSVAGLPADLTGLQDAHLTVDFLSNVGTTASGLSRSQVFATGSISLIRDTAAAEGLGTRTNLLTVTFTDAELDASQGAGAFTFKSNALSSITYSSDFLNFAKVITKDFSFSFSGANPTFQAAPGSSSRSMRFSGTGTFASDPAPVIPGVPEASTWAMMMVGFGVAGAALRTSRRSKELFAA